MIKFNNKIIIIFLILLNTGCVSYNQISNTERIITYTNISGEEINYLEKFHDETKEWFRAKCKNSNSLNIKDCSNNTEFTNLSKIKIESLLSNDEKSNSNNNVNTSQSGSNDSKDENESSEDEDSEEGEDEDGEGDWEDEDGEGDWEDWGE